MDYKPTSDWIADAPLKISTTRGTSSPTAESPSRKMTATDLLASFSPKSQSKRAPQPWNPSPKLPITMSPPKRALRPKEAIYYQISSSDESETAASPSSIFSSPKKRRRASASNVIDLEEDSVESEPPKSPLPRISSAGHSLRQHSDLHLSLRAQENGDKPVIKRRRISNQIGKRPGKKTRSPPRTSRNEIRETISRETAVKRSNFFVAKKDYFLPLLPASNSISRLIEARQTVEDITFPYEALEQQPKGIKATMKPYQLSGLSFLVYLHRNGLSGILGDEMGLGKTLQTLSLFQYLKENRKLSKPDRERRPCLVICPLSVLNSWMSEVHKWAPELKALKFHGPAAGRDRVKRIALGEEDSYGNRTNHSRRRKNERLAAAGKPIITLDSDIEDDEDGLDLIVTTYDSFKSEESWFKRAFVWSYVVLDEGHKIKNDLSQVARALQGLGTEFRLILTGTPLQNNLVELWALLRWLYPEVFTENTADLFKSSFNLTRGQVNIKVMDDARRLLELIMLRRMKNSPGVDLKLPPKTEVLLFVPLTPMQKFWYTRLLTRTDQGLLNELFQGAKEKEAIALEMEKKTTEVSDFSSPDGFKSSHGEVVGAGWQESEAIVAKTIQQERQDKGKNSAWKKLMNLLMQLRKCCNHPYLLPHASPDPYYIGEHIINASGKFMLLDKIIDELVVKQKKKVLMFSGFTKMLDCCEDLLHFRAGDGSQFKYARLDGATPRARRNLVIRLFNQESSAYRLMLISTRAGGLGVNLATASDVIMLDQDWNPQIMLQAEARAHRIGQTKPVTVYKLCTQGTVEEQMMSRIEKKLYLSAKVTENMTDIYFTPDSSTKKGPRGRPNAATQDDMPHLDKGELMSLVRRGAQAITHPEIDINEMLGWDWQTMLEKCTNKPSDTHSTESGSNPSTKAEDERKWLSQMEQVESRVFQGKVYTKGKDTETWADTQKDWSRAERRKGKNTTVMIDGFAVSKESMLCNGWEAVPTLAGKDPRLAEPKREAKAPMVNQEHCQVCWDGGVLVLCSGCPRSYHRKCLDDDFKGRSHGKMNFSCPQHECFDCRRKTSDAGGMIYRCRWCERGYCEDCLDWEKADLLDENLPEFELLGTTSVTQAFFIRCPPCINHHAANPEEHDLCNAHAADYEVQYQKHLEEKVTANEQTTGRSLMPASRAESLTNATTVSDSAISTPQLRDSDGNICAPISNKRKAGQESVETISHKRLSQTSS